MTMHPGHTHVDAPIAHRLTDGTDLGGIILLALVVIVLAAYLGRAYFAPKD